jgi:hypothetical protein
VSWRWTLTPKKTGTFVMILGIELFWQPRGEGQTPIGPLPIWGQAVQSNVDHVLGPVTIPQTSAAGAVLGILGAVFELPFVREVFGVLFARNLEQRAERRRQKQAERAVRRNARRY